MAETSSTGRATIVAVICSTAMIANQVGGKATRDALFLSSFDVTSLPLMLIGSAVFSFAVVFGSSRALRRWSPARVIPIAFFTSALLLFCEWLIAFRYPALTAVLLYLHIAGLGAVLISGFWSVVNERFDPRTAKRQIGKIAGGATFGGLIGGLLAERVAALFSAPTMLPLLGVLHLICAAALAGINAESIAPRSTTPSSGAPKRASRPESELSALQVLRSAPYLRNMASLVLLVTISTAGIDYVFKAQAARMYGGGGEDLLRFFAIFYTVIALGTFLIQTFLTQRALEKWGLAKTIGTLPVAVVAGGIGALAAPGLASAALARGMESVSNDSMFRSGYEILYTPIPAREKRATKTLVDVGVNRLGDLFGGGIIRIILFVAPAAALSLVLWLAIALAAAALWLSTRLSQGYIQSLEKNLLNRAVELNIADIQDSTTRAAVLHSGLMGSIASATSLGTGPASTATSGQRILKSTTSTNPPAPGAFSTVQDFQRSDPLRMDPLLRQITGLRSGDAAQIRKILREEMALQPALIHHVIPLLAWDEILTDVVPALRKAAPKAVDQLADALLDPGQPFAVRRRIPRILSVAHTPRSVAALLEGLQDKRFEVRFQCGCALSALHAAAPALFNSRERVFEAVEREAAVGKKVWESQRLLDHTEEMDSAPFVDELLRDRASRSLEHVFRLLALMLPREPLEIAFRGLHAGDQNLRGVALEYLESVLPGRVRKTLWPYLEDHRPAGGSQRSADKIMASLVQSHHSIELDLAALRKKLGSGPPPATPKAT